MRHKTLIWVILSVLIISFPALSQEPIVNKFTEVSRKNAFLFSQQEIASEEMTKYDVKSYYLNVSVNDTSTYIVGDVRIFSEVVQDGMSEFVVELIPDMMLDSVFVGQKKRTVVREGDLVKVSLESIPSPEENLEVRFFYHGTAPMAGFFSGLSNKEDGTWNKKVTYTLSEPFSAKDWFPVKQDLSDKIDSVKVYITVPNGLMAGSNGILHNTIDDGHGNTRYEWESHYPIDYYLISLSVSDYREYNVYAHPDGITDSVLIQNFIYNDDEYLNQKKREIDESAALIELYSEKFSLYPFHEEKYGHCVAPMGGGMEHQTMTTLSSFSFGLVAHEMGHMWFGDNITCATWQDIWINEGFASYTEYIAEQNLRSQEAADSWMENAHNLAKDRPQGSVYIPFEDADDVNRIFDYRLSYKKGAAIIHMIRFELDNDTLFFDVLKEYQARFGGKVATGLDFKGVLEDVSGKDFTTFFDQWYFGKGYPYFTLGWKQRNDSLLITSLESTSSTETPFFQMPLELKVELTDRDTLLRIFQTEELQDFKFRLGGSVTNIIVDPHRWSLFELNSISYIEDMTDRNIPFKIFPNPARDQVSIDFYGKAFPREITLTNLAGQEIMQLQSSDPILILNIRELASGAYIIQVKEDGERWNSRLLKE
jgi:aminopeptidase N